MSSGTRNQASIQQELLESTLAPALARLEAIEAANRQFAQENEALRQRLDTLQRQPSPPTSYNTSTKEPKVASPETFHGRSRSKLSHFLLALSIVLETQSSRFPTEKSKINYAVSFLRDEAMAWVQPFAIKPVHEQPDFMKDYQLFVQELKTIFGDPDEVATAERDIRRLQQRGPASAYFAEFRRLAAVLDWNDSALTSQAYSGLKDKIKDEIARIGRPSTLNELINTVSRIDTRLYERDLERNRERGNAPATSTNVTTTKTTFVPSGTGNVKVKQETVEQTTNQTPRGPLPDSEKERRRREGLCLYCGSKDHLVDACPLTKNKNRQINGQKSSGSKPSEN